MLLALLALQIDPAALSAEAKRAMESRQYARAAEAYEKLITAMPAVAGFRLNLGLARFSEGNYPAARTAFESAVKLDANAGPAWMMLGLAERKLGDAAKAAPALERAVAALPSNSIARLELADTYLTLERHREAARHFHKFTALAPADASGWFGLGLSAEAAGKEGMADLERIAPATPYRDALYARLRAEAYQYRAAYHAYRRALAAKPGFPGLHKAIAGIYRAESKLDWAAVEAGREPACKLPPAACDVTAGRYWNAAESDLKTPEATYWRALAYLELAADAYARLASLPPSGENHWRQAAVLRDQGRYPDAAAEFRKAIARKPTLPQLEREYARTLWLARDYEAAVPVLRQLISRGGASPEWTYQLGDSLLNLDRTEEAIALLRKALELDPRTPGIRGALGTALLRSGKAADAIPLLESALNGDEDGRLHFQLSRAYQAAGQPEKATAILDQRDRKLAEADKRKAAEEITAPAPDGRD